MGEGRVRGDWQKVIVGGKEEESSGERYRQGGGALGQALEGKALCKRTRARPLIVFTDLGLATDQAMCSALVKPRLLTEAVIVKLII